MFTTSILYTKHDVVAITQTMLDHERTLPILSLFINDFVVTHDILCTKIYTPRMCCLHAHTIRN